MRVINGVFHPDYFSTFVMLNNRKGRSDFEVGAGANNINFWSIIADFINDASNIELDNFFFIDDNEDYNKYTRKAESAGYLPVECSQQTGITCKAMIDGVVKIRSIMYSNMHKSGQNENDPFMYTTVAIKRQNLVRSVSQFAAYYFFMACTIHPEMDSVLKRNLSNDVRADSTENSWNDGSTPSKNKKKTIQL